MIELLFLNNKSKIEGYVTKILADENWINIIDWNIQTFIEELASKISNKCMDDQGVVDYLCSIHVVAYQFASERLRNDIDFFHQVLVYKKKQNSENYPYRSAMPIVGLPNLIRFAGEKVRSDRASVESAIASNDSLLSVEIGQNLSRNRDFLLKNAEYLSVNSHVCEDFLDDELFVAEYIAAGGDSACAARFYKNKSAIERLINQERFDLHEFWAGCLERYPPKNIAEVNNYLDDGFKVDMVRHAADFEVLALSEEFKELVVRDVGFIDLIKNLEDLKSDEKNELISSNGGALFRLYCGDPGKVGVTCKKTEIECDSIEDDEIKWHTIPFSRIEMAANSKSISCTDLMKLVDLLLVCKLTPLMSLNETTNFLPFFTHSSPERYDEKPDNAKLIKLFDAISKNIIGKIQKHGYLIINKVPDELRIINNELDISIASFISKTRGGSGFVEANSMQTFHSQSTTIKFNDNAPPGQSFIIEKPTAASESSLSQRISIPLNTVASRPVSIIKNSDVTTNCASWKTTLEEKIPEFIKIILTPFTWKPFRLFISILFLFSFLMVFQRLEAGFFVTLWQIFISLGLWVSAKLADESYYKKSRFLGAATGVFVSIIGFYTGAFSL